jgi:peptidoglycan/LPS O-acetylase OafA/YrhL
VRKIHPGDVPGLTRLRFLTAFSVLIAHAFAVRMHFHDNPGSFRYWVTQASGFGMTLFFVLSGFISLSARCVAHPALAGPRLPIILALSWCALWIGLATTLNDRAPDINAWALARYGTIPEMRAAGYLCGIGFLRAVAALFLAIFAYGRVRVRQPDWAILHSVASP